MKASFAQAYLLVFAKLAAGFIAALAVPRPGELDRAYYRGAAAIAGLLALAVAAAEFSFVPTRTSTAAGGTVAWALEAVLLIGYGASWRSGHARWRARMFPPVLAGGFAALLATALPLVELEPGWSAKALAISGVVAGALFLGGTSAATLAGHWFFSGPRSGVEVLARLVRYCRVALAAEAVCFAFQLAAVGIAETHPLEWTSAPFRLLLAVRVSAWVAATAVLRLAATTLTMGQPVAATGLFYVATLAALVGEIAASWLLFHTGLPL